MSEVMNVPDGWEIKSIAELADVIGGGTPKRTDEDSWLNGDIIWVTPSDITKIKNSNYVSNSKESISVYGLSNSSSKLLPVNSILLTSRATIGARKINTVPMCTNQGFTSLIPKKDNTKYLYYMLDRYEQYMFSRAYGTTFPEISRTEVKNVSVVLPKDIKEQQQISSILSTLDQAIEESQKLIEKEKNIKKGLMHDLLTNGIDKNGKIRNPKTHEYKESELGLIPEDWEVKRLEDVGQCKSGLTYSPSDITNENGILVLRSSNIQNSKLSFIDNVFVQNDIRLNYNVEEGDILVCIRNGSKNLIGKNTLITKEAEGMAHGAFMTVFHSENYKYIFQLFQSDMFFQRVEKNLGATINSINNSDLVLFEFPFPLEELEQKKIANILTVQDKKIETEESNLEKLKKLKKGLMNDLLIGEVRVRRL